MWWTKDRKRARYEWIWGEFCSTSSPVFLSICSTILSTSCTNREEEERQHRRAPQSLLPSVYVFSVYGLYSCVFKFYSPSWRDGNCPVRKELLTKGVQQTCCSRRGTDCWTATPVVMVLNGSYHRHHLLLLTLVRVHVFRHRQNHWSVETVYVSVFSSLQRPLFLRTYKRKIGGAYYVSL